MSYVRCFINFCHLCRLSAHLVFEIATAVFARISSVSSLWGGSGDGSLTRVGNGSLAEAEDGSVAEGGNGCLAAIVGNAATVVSLHLRSMCSVS